MPIFGRPNIRKLKSRHDVEGLLKALDYEKDINIPIQAVAALGEIRAKKAVERLIAVLDNKDWPDPEGVVTSLGKIGDERAVPSLIRRVIKTGASSSSNELDALRKIGRNSIAPLLDLMKDRTTDMKDAAEILVVLEAIGGEDVLTGLLDLLDRGNPSLMPHLAETLRRLGDRRALPSLITALKTGAGESWASNVAGVLDELGWTPSAVEEQAALSLARRQWQSLATLGPAAVDVLLPFLHRGRSSEILKTVEILGDIGDPRGEEPVIALLDDRRDEIVNAACRVLGRFGGAMSVEPLLQLISESESSTAVAAAELALINIGTNAVKDLIGHLNSVDSDIRRTVVRLLGEIGDERALPHLLSARDDPSLVPELETALDTLGWEPPSEP